MGNCNSNNREVFTIRPKYIIANPKK